MSSCNLIRMGRNAIRRSGADPPRAWSDPERLATRTRCFCSKSGGKTRFEPCVNPRTLPPPPQKASFSGCAKTQRYAASDSRCGLLGERFAVFCLLCSLKASQQTLDAFVRPLSSDICCWLLVPSNRLLMISRLILGLMRRRGEIRQKKVSFLMYSESSRFIVLLFFSYFVLRFH